ncbi:MAG TPA: tetratricopeptide repeat protein [Chroococcales cyanobacterium]
MACEQRESLTASTGGKRIAAWSAFLAFCGTSTAAVLAGSISENNLEKSEEYLQKHLYRHAMPAAQMAIVLAGKDGNLDDRVKATVIVGKSNIGLSQYDLAEKNFKDAIALTPAGAKSAATADALTGMARVCMNRNDLKSAKSYLDRALAMRNALPKNDKASSADTHLAMAELNMKQKSYAAAAAQIEQALRLSTRPGAQLAEILDKQGELFEAQGKYEKAQAIYDKALLIEKSSLKESSEPGKQAKETFYADTYMGLGRIAAHRRDFKTAQDCFKRAATLYVMGCGGFDLSASRAEFALGQAYESQGNYEKATEHYRTCRTVRQELLKSTDKLRLEAESAYNRTSSQRTLQIPMLSRSKAKGQNPFRTEPSLSQAGKSRIVPLNSPEFAHGR